MFNCLAIGFHLDDGIDRQAARAGFISYETGPGPDGHQQIHGIGSATTNFSVALFFEVAQLRHVP
jgi:hypothetical protein